MSVFVLPLIRKTKCFGTKIGVKPYRATDSMHFFAPFFEKGQVYLLFSNERAFLFPFKIMLDNG